MENIGELALSGSRDRVLGRVRYERRVGGERRACARHKWLPDRIYRVHVLALTTVVVRDPSEA